MLSVFVCGCETWCLTLKQERRLSEFEKRLLRKIFGHRRDEITRAGRKLPHGELNDLQFSPSVIQVIKSIRTIQ